MVFGLAAYMHFFNGGFRLMTLGFFLLVASAIV
jgi:hypothetical protein